MSLETEHRHRLFALARQAIEAGLSGGRPLPLSACDLPPELTDLRCCFVTLKVGIELRGCCGNLNASRSLAEDVWVNAWAAAFADPRFMPLNADEWPDVHLHISVLSPMEILPVANEAELLHSLRPSIDGIVLERDDTRATFLPEVWEQVPSPADFIHHLKEKAGWPAIGWSPHIKVWRYTTESFAERDVD